MDESGPLARGVIGELFFNMRDPVLIVTPQGAVKDVNPAAEVLLGAGADAIPDLAAVATRIGLHIEDVDRFVAGEADLVMTQDGRIAFSVVSFSVGGDHTALILRDVSIEQRQLMRLRSLNAIAREVLTQDTVEVVLQSVVDEAKRLTDADFSALLLLREGSRTEISRFVYNAPRELFPDRLPRAIGLLAVPIETRAPARLSDIRGHAAGVGIPDVKHPPISALLAVPLLVEDDVIGELAVAHQPDRGDFTALDEAVLTELGAHAVQAIQLAQAREASLAADAARAGMLDLLRHDMMTPISTARGAVEMLTNNFDQLTDAQREALLGALGRAVENVERLARNLRFDARLEAPHLEQEFSDIDVLKLLEELRADLESAAQREKVELKVLAEEDSPVRFRGAYLLVRQALENLVTNAIRHSPEDGEVTITSRAEGESIRFDVRNDGPGIPPAEQAGLFVRFERRRRKDDRPQPGLGLGLSIVRRIAEAHGGNVGVSSQPGQGATFWISFPLVPIVEEQPVSADFQ